MKTVICIEDAADMREIIKRALSDYYVLFVGTCREGKGIIANGGFSLLLLDISLPDGDGLEMLNEMQQQNLFPQGLPVIMLTGARGIQQKATAFSFGVEDYLVKPVDPAELRIRVDARIKRCERNIPQSETQQIGDLILNAGEQKLFQPGTNAPIDLTTTEFRVFAILAKSPGRIVSRDSLSQRVWGENVEVSEQTINTHIARLRRKLFKSSVKIETIFRAGYKLTS